MVDLELLRARHAFRHTGGLCRERRDRAEVLSLARKLPEMLQTNGLLATWAYLRAKEGENPACGKLRRALEEHMGSEELAPLPDLLPKLEAVFSSGGPAEERILSGPELRRLTSEAILQAGWLKRAAEALCGEPEPAGEGEPEEENLLEGGEEAGEGAG